MSTNPGRRTRRLLLAVAASVGALLASSGAHAIDGYTLQDLELDSAGDLVADPQFGEGGSLLLQIRQHPAIGPIAEMGDGVGAAAGEGPLGGAGIQTGGGGARPQRAVGPAIERDMRQAGLENGVLQFGVGRCISHRHSPRHRRADGGFRSRSTMW